MDVERVSEKFSYPSQYIDVYGSKMHYVEAGQGSPILFLHGIPTSCYLWRNIIPHLTSLGRCIAPDLIGFGRSDKPDIAYSISDHINYIEKFIEELALSDLTLIMHGWGSVIGFDYAMRHEKNCKGLVFYEAFLRSSNGDDMALPFQEQLMILQDQESLADAAVHSDAFIDKIISQQVMRQLTDEEMDNYRRPFQQQGHGQPLVQYLKELPKGDDKNAVNKIIENYSKKLTRSSLPKLMLYSVPGFITPISTIMWAKENLTQLEVVDIGEELHLAQESYPQLIGETISVWLQGVEALKE